MNSIDKQAKYNLKKNEKDLQGSLTIDYEQGIDVGFNAAIEHRDSLTCKYTVENDVLTTSCNKEVFVDSIIGKAMGSMPYCGFCGRWNDKKNNFIVI